MKLSKGMVLVWWYGDGGGWWNGEKVMCFAVLAHSTVSTGPPGALANRKVRGVLCGCDPKVKSRYFSNPITGSPALIKRQKCAPEGTFGSASGL